MELGRERTERKLSKIVVLFYLLVFFLLNVSVSSVYFTTMSLSMILLSLLVVGIIFMPIFLIIPIFEWIFNKMFKTLRENTMAISISFILAVIVLIGEILIISSYSFINLPYWLGFEGASYIIPLGSFILAIIPTYLYNKSKERTVHNIFGFYYPVNVLLMCFIYAPYAFGGFLN